MYNNVTGEVQHNLVTSLLFKLSRSLSRSLVRPIGAASVVSVPPTQCFLVGFVVLVENGGFLIASAASGRLCETLFKKKKKKKTFVGTETTPGDFCSAETIPQ